GGLYGYLLNHTATTEIYTLSLHDALPIFGNAAIPTDTLVMIRKMIDTLSVVHVKPEAFQFAIEQQLPELVEFIKEKDLLYIDPSDRKSTRLNSSHVKISYAVFCLKKKNNK